MDELYARLTTVNEGIREALCGLACCDPGFKHVVQTDLGAARERMGRAALWRELKKTLEEEQEALRASIAALSRPRLRALNILDLPGEVLSEAFAHVRGPLALHKEDSSVFECKNESSTPIKNVRLVCRRFHDAGTHLLLRYVRVDMDPESIARLLEISRHPILRKAVHGIKLSLNFYSTTLARNFNTFISFSLTQLRKELRRLQDLREWKTVEKDIRQLEFYIRKASFISHAWETLLNPAIFLSPFESKDRTSYQQLLRDTHSEYQRRYAIQERLRQSGSFVRAIGAAFANMPQASKVEVCGGHWMDRVDITFDQLRSDAAMREALILPIPWDDAMALGLQKAPLDVLVDLPMAIGDAGGRLTHLALRVPSVQSYGLLAQSEQKLGRLAGAVRSLAVLDFSFRAVPNRLWMPRTPEFDNLTRYLAVLLGAPGLHELRLDFSHLWDSALTDLTIPPDFSLGPVLRIRPWHGLRRLHLYYMPLELAELEEFLARRRRPLEMIDLTSVRLLSGTWREALDVLRAHYGGYLTLDAPSGAECDDMTWDEKNRIFGKASKWASHAGRSRAEQYITGLAGQQGNPFLEHEILGVMVAE